MTVTLHNGDCMEYMKAIPSNSIDLILCDPPYGTIANLDYNQMRNTARNWEANTWDAKLPTAELFAEYERILRPKGRVILFSAEPYTSQLRTHTTANLQFNYPLYYLKNNSGNSLFSHTAPLHYVEDLSVWTKQYDGGSDPTRQYVKQILDYIKATAREVEKQLGHRRLDHFLRWNSIQFGYPMRDAYEQFVTAYNLTDMPGYHDYEWLMEAKAKAKATPTFNYDIDEGHTSVSNVLRFNREPGYTHPTQKPLKLMERLVALYSNPGDVILDNTMGSGTTGVAAVNLGRSFIGCELDANFYEDAKLRIEDAQERRTNQCQKD